MGDVKPNKKLGKIVKKIRSKNAGPFWITVDIFCGTKPVFEQICAGLTNARAASLISISEGKIKRFELNELNVVKVSFPRKHIQGSRADRDMHGAQIAELFAELEL